MSTLAASARKRAPSSLGGWRLFALLAGLAILAPVLVIAAAWLRPAPELWGHLSTTLLPELLRNTVLLVVGVGSGTLLLGVSLAWLTAMCEFPGRRLFDWALMLPLAVPAYVLAFVFIGLFDYASPLQTLLRGWFGSDFALPPIRSAGGVILVMVLVLYPYVYMLSRAAFLRQGPTPLEVARIQGLGSWAAFCRVSLPMARPAIVAGLSLVLMEALADFGAVSVFNFNTFTTAIYKAWFSFFSLPMAAQLASLLLLFVLVALFLERRARGKARFFQSGASERMGRIRLRGWRAGLATGLAALVLGLAFVLPILQLLVWAAKVVGELDAAYVRRVEHTLTLGALAALVTVTIALLLAYAKRLHRDRLTRYAVAGATIGYAMPGSVLAVGIMLSLTWIDHRLVELTGLSGQWLSGTLWALLLAYTTRFMAVAFGAVESALEQIRPVLADAARSLGAGHAEVIRRVYVPMLRPGLLTAALLVAVDVMKEMPATLLLRPFGWDTLALQIFQLTSEGQWQRAALPALALVAVGLLPVVLLVRRSAAERPSREAGQIFQQG